jgi:O-acetyl-ADP-ribose deacetylase (regulator of RNase III)
MRDATIVRGDITELDVDAIVNAANESLLGGGGVDGAIHAAAGPELLAACRGLGGCRPGEAKLTPGFALRARWVIHTVGPRWSGGRRGEEEVLRGCYRRSIAIARERGLRSLAFPSISTGAFGYPIELAAPVALDEIRRGLDEAAGLGITVVCFGTEVLRAYRSLAR